MFSPDVHLNINTKGDLISLEVNLCLTFQKMCSCSAKIDGWELLH